MLSLDLFNTVYERALNEGAVDDLEARHIHGLNTKMLELMGRAKGAKPEMKAALMREYNKIKDERDSYFKIRTSSTNEAGLPDIADKQAKMAQLNQPGKAGSDAVTPQQRVNPNPNKGIIGHAKDWLRGKGGPGKEGPTYESELSEEDEQLYKDIGAGYGVYNELLKAWEEKKPYIIIPMPGGGNLSVTRNQIFNVLFALKNMKDQQFKKTLQTAFSNLDKFMIWSNTIKRYQLPPEKPEPAAGGIAPGGKEMTQVNLPLKERSNQKKNSKDIDTPQSTAIQRYLTKVRRAAPNATSDIEAVARHDLEQQTRTDKTINDLKAVNARQDQALKQAMSLDQQQGNEINDLESQLGQLSQKLQLIKTAKPAANQPVASTPTTPATTPAKTLSKTDTAQATQPARVPTETPVISIAEPANLSQKDQEIYTKVKDLETELKSKIDAMASWNKVAQKDDESRNELEMLRKDMERTKRELNHKIKQLKKSGAVTMEPRQNRQTSLDLAPGNRRVDPSALLRQRLGQTLGTVDRPRELPVQSDLNILSQDDFNKLAGNLTRTKQPVEVEEGQMSELDAMRQDLERMSDRQFSIAYGMSKAIFKQRYRTLLAPAPQQSTPVIDEHGGGIGPKQHWQDLMQENKLAVGDPIVVTGPNEFEGKTGEIYNFSPSGTFVIVDLYNHGKHSMHLSDIVYNEYADREQDEEDDWYDDEDTMEGWSDAMVSQRTGQPRTPYSVYIKGKKWKDFENEDHAEAVANKLRAKFKAEGRDPSVITIAATDYDKGIDEAQRNPWNEKHFGPGEVVQKVFKVKADNGKSYNVKAATEQEARETLQKHAPDANIASIKFVSNIMDEAANPAQQAAIAIAKKKEQGVAEGAMSNLRDELADVYHRMAPGIERHRDSFKAGQLYDALEAVAEQHGAKTEFKRMINGARNRAHMDYDTNPGGFQNWFWYLPFADEINEDQDTSGVESAIIRRIMVAHVDWLQKFGPEKVMQAAEEVAYNVGDVDEIGTSDVSAYVHEVGQILGVDSLNEKWSAKYKSSINCSNPKGFSQKAHCAGRKK